MFQRILLTALWSGAMAAAAVAAPVTIVDLTPTSATRNGTIGAGEYVGHGAGINSGFGNVIGSESELHVDSSETALHFGLRRGSGFFSNEAVIYIDSVAGGFADTTSLSDTNDPLRSAISGNSTNPGDDSELFFAPGFEADYAIGFDEGFAGLWRLASGGNDSLDFRRNVNLTPPNMAQALDFEMDLLLMDIGLAAGGSFRYVMTYMNAQDFGLFRADEFHGVSGATVSGGNPGRNNVTLAAGDFNTFQTYAAPIPEPGSLGLIAVGALIGAMAIRRRR